MKLGGGKIEQRIFKKKTISAVNWFVPFVSVSVNSEAHEISLLTESFWHVHVFSVCLIVSIAYGTYFSNALLIEKERKPQLPFLKRSTEQVTGKNRK